jgi:hypothetical protein
MEYIHKNIVAQVKGFNYFARNEENLKFKEELGYVNPVVSIMHSCAQHLQKLEYSASSDPIEETKTYIRMKINIKDFT